jgi:hypothetical protein
MKRLTLLLVMLLAGCGRPAAKDKATAADVEGDDTLAVAPDTALPPMPDLPQRRRGYFTASAVGDLTFDKAWVARAGRCARPPMILVLGEERGAGGSILLQLPASGPSTGVYPVRLADSTGMPEAPAAQLGFQFFDKPGPSAYQAADGAVEITSLDDRRVSGTFRVTVRHITTNRRAQIAGAFQAVDVEPLTPAWCETAQAAQDSLARKQQ